MELSLLAKAPRQYGIQSTHHVNPRPSDQLAIQALLAERHIRHRRSGTRHGWCAEPEDQHADSCVQGWRWYCEQIFGTVSSFEGSGVLESSRAKLGLSHTWKSICKGWCADHGTREGGLVTSRQGGRIQTAAGSERVDGKERT